MAGPLQTSCGFFGMMCHFGKIKATKPAKIVKLKRSDWDKTKMQDKNIEPDDADDDDGYGGMSLADFVNIYMNRKRSAVYERHSLQRVAVHRSLPVELSPCLGLHRFIGVAKPKINGPALLL